MTSSNSITKLYQVPPREQKEPKPCNLCPCNAELRRPATLSPRHRRLSKKELRQEFEIMNQQYECEEERRLQFERKEREQKRKKTLKYKVQQLFLFFFPTTTIIWK